MISKKTINNILSEYDSKKIRIGTICSHSALQIFHGARQEGFATLGICTEDRKKVYEAFPLATPDEFLIVDNFKDIVKEKFQDNLRDKNVIIVPHGSFVEYVGPEALLTFFNVPMFGNRKTLEWEGDRSKQRIWLEKADLKLPKEYKHPSEIDGKVFVKFSGAKGGKGFFTANSETEYYKKLKEKVKKGIIREEDSLNAAIQEFVSGVRYYNHYFFSIFENYGFKVGKGALELLSMDKRIEPIDESQRGLPDVPEEFYDYTVTGNQPVIVRESLLPKIFEMGNKTILSSIRLFPPGMLGAFCLETIYQPEKGFTVFEISARIVAGTNLYPTNSPYSVYIFKEQMSTGRRIARELKTGIETNALDKIVF